MPRSRTPAEHRTITTLARMTKLAAAVHTSSRNAEEAAAAADRARADAARAIADVAPLLSDAQREQLRGALA